MTIELVRAPWGDPQVRAFEQRSDETFATAAASPGSVARLGVVGGPDGRPRVVPAAWADPAYEDRRALTCSVWTDAESAFAFSYRGFHGASLRDRHEWFSKIDLPSHVAWWIEEGRIPTRAESAERYAELVGRGPTVRAVDFRSPFDAGGRTSAIDRGVVRDLVAVPAIIEPRSPQG